MTLLPSHGTKSFLSACLIASSIILPHAALAETIGLQDALRKTIAVAPERLASSATVRATQASIDQAGQRPLPELSLEADNFPAIGGDRIGTRLETTLSYAQRIEMGGKRAARIKVAEGETLASKAQRTVDMLDLFLTVETAWVEALAADADLALANQKLKISSSIASELRSRVDAGRDPKFIAARGTADANAARAEYERAQSEARARASELASFWGVGAARVTLDPADFVDLKRTPSAAGVSPDEAVYTARSRTARAKFTLEQSNSVQDPNVSVGVRYFNNDRDAASSLACLSRWVGTAPIVAISNRHEITPSRLSKPPLRPPIYALAMSPAFNLRCKQASHKRPACNQMSYLRPSPHSISRARALGAALSLISMSSRPSDRSLRRMPRSMPSANNSISTMRCSLD